MVEMVVLVLRRRGVEDGEGLLLLLLYPGVSGIEASTLAVSMGPSGAVVSLDDDVALGVAFGRRPGADGRTVVVAATSPNALHL